VSSHVYEAAGEQKAFPRRIGYVPGSVAETARGNHLHLLGLHHLIGAHVDLDSMFFSIRLPGSNGEIFGVKG
jgi:hypothetical protein